METGSAAEHEGKQNANLSAGGLSGGDGCPFHGKQWQQRANADTIPCPALLSFYNNGWLGVDGAGNVKLDSLKTALTEAGIGEKVREVLLRMADGSDAIPNSFNLFELRESTLNHTGSTGVRDQRVAPAALEEALLRFSEEGRMYAEHFAAAANFGAQRDPGLKGTIFQTIEFRALLEVFGRQDDNQERYLTVEDVKGLWLEGRFPDGWQPRPKDEIDKGDILRGVAMMAVHRLLRRLQEDS
jgi:hypothetical protein